MNKCVRAGAGALAIGCAVASAAVAHADNGAFSGPRGDQNAGAMWVDTHNFLPDDWGQAKAQDMARLVCLKLLTGESEGQLIAEISEGDGSSLSGIGYVVHAAEWHYCPTYY